MTGVLAAYLRRRVLGQTLALLAVLTALMQVLELLDVTTEILDRELGVAGLLRYALLRTPSELIVALPLAALLGAMAALFAMARSHEITAMRVAGLSLRRLLLLLLPVPLLLGLAQFALSQTLVPYAQDTLKRWWDASAPVDEAQDPRWVRTRAGPLSFAHASHDGTRLTGVRLYLPDAQGQFAQRLSAHGARWDGREWVLEQVQVLQLRDAERVRVQYAEQRLSLNLHPDDVLRLDVVQPQLSSIILVDLIVGERAGAQPLSYYQTVLLRSYTAPLGAFIMLLLALPAARASSRSGGGGALLVALVLGLGFLLCDGIAAALGTSGRVPALAAAVAAPLLFALIGYTHLYRCDRT